MSNFPLISYIIPFHNAEETILNCLKSIEAQDCKGSYELLLVNNNSTDESLSVLKKAGHPVLNELNPGAACARNLGLRYAKGKYLIFLDADIELEKNWTQEMIRELENSWADAVMSSIFPQIQKGNFVLRFMKSFRSAYIAEKTKSYFHYLTAIFQGLPVVNSAAFAVRKDFVIKNNLQFDPQLLRCEDVDFSYQLFLSGAHLKAVSTTCAYVSDDRGPWAYLKRSFWTGYYTAYLKCKWAGSAPYPWQELARALGTSWSFSPVQILIKMNKIFALLGEFLFDRKLLPSSTSTLQSFTKTSANQISFLNPFVRLIEFKDYFILFHIETSKTKIFTGISAQLASSFFKENFKKSSDDLTIPENLKTLFIELSQEKFLLNKFDIKPEALVYQKNNFILEKRTQERIVLVHLEKADFIYEIEGLCEQIWNLIDGKSSTNDILKKAYSELEDGLCTKEEFYQDASSFIEDLANENIICLKPLQGT